MRRGRSLRQQKQLQFFWRSEFKPPLLYSISLYALGCGHTAAAFCGRYVMARAWRHLTAVRRNRIDENGCRQGMGGQRARVLLHYRLERHPCTIVTAVRPLSCTENRKQNLPSLPCHPACIDISPHLPRSTAIQLEWHSRATTVVL